MINFHNYRLDENEIIGISDVRLEHKKKASRAYCFVYYKNYPAKIATVWEKGKTPHRLPFLSDHLHLATALEDGDIEIYKQYKAAATEKHILKKVFGKKRGADPAPKDNTPSSSAV